MQIIKNKTLQVGTITAGVGLLFSLMASPATAAPLDASSVFDAIEVSSEVANVENAVVAQAVAKMVFDSANPESAFLALEEDDKALFKAFVATEKVTSTGGLSARAAAALPDGCHTVPGGRQAYNAFGGQLWAMTHQHQACVSGGTITSATFTGRSAEATWAGWRHVEHGDQSTGVIAGQSRQYVQETFALGAGGWDIETVNPCSRSAMDGSGNIIPSTACNITLGS